MNEKELKELEEEFFVWNYDSLDPIPFHHYPLCYALRGTKYYCKWENYWEIINTDRKMYAPDYLCSRNKYFWEKVAFLRLVILHDFLRDIGEIK
jgi:hypothetical protein